MNISDLPIYLHQWNSTHWWYSLQWLWYASILQYNEQWSNALPLRNDVSMNDTVWTINTRGEQTKERQFYSDCNRNDAILKRLVLFTLLTTTWNDECCTTTSMEQIRMIWTSIFTMAACMQGIQWVDGGQTTPCLRGGSWIKLATRARMSYQNIFLTWKTTKLLVFCIINGAAAAGGGTSFGKERKIMRSWWWRIGEWNVTPW